MLTRTAQEKKEPGGRPSPSLLHDLVPRRRCLFAEQAHQPPAWPQTEFSGNNVCDIFAVMCNVCPGNFLRCTSPVPPFWSIGTCTLPGSSCYASSFRLWTRNHFQPLDSPMGRPGLCLTYASSTTQFCALNVPSSMPFSPGLSQGW